MQRLGSTLLQDTSITRLYVTIGSLNEGNPIEAVNALVEVLKKHPRISNIHLILTWHHSITSQVRSAIFNSQLPFNLVESNRNDVELLINNKVLPSLVQPCHENKISQLNELADLMLPTALTNRIVDKNDMFVFLQQSVGRILE